MKEIWKDIEGYEGLYQASNLGNVRSYYGNGKILKPILHNTGYVQVTLCKNGIKTQYRLHKIIAMTFIPNKDNKKTINHKDGNKQNNCVDNLEWMTITENNRHAYATNLNKGLKGKDNVCSKKVAQLTLDGKLIKIWDCTMDIQRELKISNSCISAVCLGKYKQSHGYKWKYLEK